MRSGAAPAINSRSTRMVRTWVLPVPALAPTHADTAGSDAAACAFVVSANGSPAVVVLGAATRQSPSPSKPRHSATRAKWA